jgi:ABC-type dipeptide/oligopeptide/nickel transport system permease component
VLVLLGTTIIIFATVRVIPGDPARLMLPADATAEDVERFRERMGFDEPVYRQYGTYLKGLLVGDLGRSMRYRRPVLELVLERLPATIELAGVAAILAVLVAVPAGIVSAIKRDSLYDNAFMFLSVFAQSVPIFWLGIVMILVFSVQLHWLPTSGRGTLRQLILPGIALATYISALLARLTRSCMLEVLMQDYVRTARAKGLRELSVTCRHALKNAVVPIVTVLGLQIGTLLGGSVIVETVFAWPGIGTLAVGAIYNRDYPLIQGTVLIAAVMFVVTNLVVDLVYLYLDPRIRYG